MTIKSIKKLIYNRAVKLLSVTVNFRQKGTVKYYFSVAVVEV